METGRICEPFIVGYVDVFANMTPIYFQSVLANLQLGVFIAGYILGLDGWIRTSAILLPKQVV